MQNKFPRGEVNHQGICSPSEMCAYIVLRAQCTSVLAPSTLLHCQSRELQMFLLQVVVKIPFITPQFGSSVVECRELY